MKKLICLLVASAFFIASAQAQQPGKLESGQVLGNPTASAANSRASAIVSVLNAACTLSPSTCNFFFGHYSPEWFGALCDGTTNDTAAIQAAIDANGSGPVHVQLAACTYKFTAISWTKNFVTFNGAGRYITYMKCEPGGAGQCITIGSVAGETIGHDVGKFSIISSDTTHIKQGIVTIDISSSLFHDISCNQAGQSGTVFTGGSASSCLDLFGRDLTSYENMELSADIPIILNLNPNVYLSTDHWVFRDIYLVGPAGSAQPCILVQTGIVITNLTFTGRQAWVRCAGGFLAVDTTSAVSWNNLRFENVRTEQNTGGATAISFNISPNNQLLNLIIDGGQLDPNSKGIVLSKVFGATISNNQASCTVATFLTASTNSDQIQLSNNRLSSACTASLGNLVATNIVTNPTGSTVPSSALYLAAASGIIVSIPKTIANLPTCNAAKKGSKDFVTDNNTALAFAAVITNGGAIQTPVYCDGTIWRQG